MASFSRVYTALLSEKENVEKGRKRENDEVIEDETDLGCEMKFMTQLISRFTVAMHFPSILFVTKFHIVTGTEKV